MKTNNDIVPAFENPPEWEAQQAADKAAREESIRKGEYSAKAKTLAEAGVDVPRGIPDDVILTPVER